MNDRVALDAGALAQALPLDRQRRIDTILLTHSHMDHTNSLPFFVENVYDEGAGEIVIWASEATTYAIRRYLFNNDAWPDFTRLPNNLLQRADKISRTVETVQQLIEEQARLARLHGQKMSYTTSLEAVCAQLEKPVGLTTY